MSCASHCHCELARRNRPVGHDPIEHLQIFDSIHKLQGHVPRLALVSKQGQWLGVPWFTLRRLLGLWVTGTKRISPCALGDDGGEACDFACSSLLASALSISLEITRRLPLADATLREGLNAVYKIRAGRPKSVDLLEV